MNYAIRELAKDQFPPLLKEIPDPPKKLFIKGKLPDEEVTYLAVVGARKFTNYGKEACEKLIEGLQGYQVAIVSGLALGIDSIAHLSALRAGLKTIAFPGSGLSEKVLYPSMNIGLAKKILDEGGALISEFEPEFRATPYSFPVRNRLMAGISSAVLIIEAELKSGTLITSKLATEYNRDVLAVPGSIFSRNSDGPHMLIRLGATPITKEEDLIEALRLKKAEASDEFKYRDCSEEEMKIIEALKEPLSREELIQNIEMPISQVNTLLSIMEIKGLIKESMGEMHLT